MGQEDTAVDDRGIPEPGQQQAKGAGARGVELDTQQRCGRSHTGARAPWIVPVCQHARRAQASLLDDRADPGWNAALEPAERPDRDPAGDDQLGAPIRGHGPDRGNARPDRAQVHVVGRTRATKQEQVERTIDVEREAPPRPQIRYPVAGYFLEPARKRVVAREVRDRGQRPDGADRDDVRGEPVVGQRYRIVRRGNCDKVRVVPTPRQRDRPRSKDHEPIGPIGLEDLSEPRPERCIVGRPAEDGDVGGTRLAERHAVTLGERGPCGGDPALDRPGGRTRFRMEDANGDLAMGHGNRVYPSSDRRTVSDRRVRAYIGLGANVGDADATLASAVTALDELAGSRVRGVSRLYATDPVGVLDQPEFRNAVVALDVRTGADPASGALSMLTVLKTLERSFGRRRGHRWGPRELDLDLLIYGRARLVIERPPEGQSLDADIDPEAASKLLVVPHPSAAERLFVLAPLADLAPGLVPPGWRRTVERTRRQRLAVEGSDAVRAIATWNAVARAWRRIQPR